MKQRHFRKIQARLSHNAYLKAHPWSATRTNLTLWHGYIVNVQAEMLLKTADEALKQFIRQQLGQPYSLDIDGFSVPSIDDAPKIPVRRILWDAIDEPNVLGMLNTPFEIIHPNHINPRKDDNHE